MSLKKMLAAVSGVILAAQTLLPVSVLGATNYGDEMQGAYDYAYSEGITTQYPIDNADMFGAMTRAQMAKMLGQWAINTLGMAPDTSKTCSFTDTASVQGDLADWIIKSCQLGLMGQGITAFRPYDTVTRGEFGTVLSRAIRGDENDGGTPYYQAHLNALKNAGIMTQINPDMKEVRGYVMIMLQRAAGNEDVIAGGKAQCNDPIIQLACIMETDACPSICKEGNQDGNIDDGSSQVKAGNLDVNVTDYSSTIKSAPNQGTVIFNNVSFKASQSITLNGIVVAMAGLTSRGSVDKVWLEKDGVAVTSKLKPTVDGTATLNFKGGFVVKSTENLDLVVALTGAAGAEVSFKITGISSSAEKVNLGDVLSTTYRTTTYKVANLSLSTNSNLTGTASTFTEYKLGSQPTYTIGELRVSNDGANSEDRIVNLKSVLLKNTQSTDLSFFKNIQVLREGTNVAKNVSIDGRNLTITLNDTINAGKRAVYTIVAEIGNMTDVPSKVQLQLQAMSDVVADEAGSNFRTQNSADNGNDSLYFDAFQFNGGKITFENDSTFASVISAAQGSVDVAIASGTLKLTEPVSFGKLTLTSVGSVTGTESDITRLALEIGGTRYVAEQTYSAGTTTYTWDKDTIYAQRSATIRLIATVRSTATGTVTFSPNMLSSAQFTSPVATYLNGDTSDTAEIAGRIQISQLRVETPKFALNNTLSSTVNAVVNETSTKTIFEGPISSKSPVTVSKFDLTVTSFDGFASGLTDVNFDLYVNGNLMTSQVIKNMTGGSTTTFNVNLPVDATAKTVKINANLASAGTGRFVASVVARGTDSDSNETKSSPINTVAFRVLNAASVSVSNSTSTSAVVIEGANAKLTDFTASVQDGTINLAKVTVVGTNFPI